MNQDLVSRLEQDFSGAKYYLKETRTEKTQNAWPVVTPTIALKDKDLYIIGNSFPENAAEFYKGTIDMVKKLTPKGEIIAINVYLDNFLRASTSKCLLDIFKAFEYGIKEHYSDLKLDFDSRLDSQRESGEWPTISWYYDNGNHDMIEAGEDYQRIIKGVSFQLVMKEK